jgi:hypothetical protein
MKKRKCYGTLIKDGIQWTGGIENDKSEECTYQCSIREIK